MLEEIVERARGASYDFRATACPGDPLRHLFDDWLPYYRTKWAIASVLQPATVLEVGVRYGYSALAFLDACPQARYLGIDLDSDTFGGAKGAIDWARRATRGYQADFLVADSQRLDAFPGGCYDLIHVDGQQDGAGSQHDLELAIAQARLVLADGYFWTRDNFLALSEFLFRHRDLIEFYGVIPGYAGELLIRTRAGAPRARAARSSADLRETYSESYYLTDCGGYDSYKRHRGRVLETPRLRVMADLAATVEPGPALDLGAGRGELSLHLAGQGFQVTGIDYSPDAVRLAEQTCAGVTVPGSVRFLCGSVNEVPLEGRYRVALAADLIEHLLPAELDRLYARISGCLSPDGLLVVHTFPNLWFYRYEHARRLRIARSLGAYLPADPRSRYEKLMHINEQSPRVLRRQLGRHFEHVLLWFAGHDTGDPLENLQRRYSIAEMRGAADLFVVASHSPAAVDRVRRLARMDPLPEPAPHSLELQVLSVPEAVSAGSVFTVPVRVSNRTGFVLNSRPPHPVRLSYHWLTPDGVLLLRDGLRTPLFPHLRAGAAASFEMTVEAPAAEGRYLLMITPVQEAVRWFDDVPGASQAAPLTVRNR